MFDSLRTCAAMLVATAMVASCGSNADPEADAGGEAGISNLGDDEGADGDSDDSSDDSELTVRFDAGPQGDFVGGGDGDGGGEAGDEAVCEIDFLFVIDNSGSMAGEQMNLSNSVPEFIETVTQQIENVDSFHLAVVPTQTYAQNTPDCQAIGGMIKKTGGPDSSGRMCSPYASGSGFMSDEDDLTDKFTCAAKPGTPAPGDSVAGDERPMDAMIAALTGPHVEEGGCNAGFLRKDALLVVVVITDEEDNDETVDCVGGVGGNNPGSAGDPQQWHEKLLEIKGGRQDLVVTLGLLGTPLSQDCAMLGATCDFPGFDGAELSPRLQAFVELSGDRGFVGDVCAPNYDPFFDSALEVLDFACDNIIPPE